MFQTFKNYLNTLKYLKPIQVKQRLLRNFKKPLSKEYSSVRASAPFSDWVGTEIGRPRIVGNHFAFLNKKGHSIKCEDKWNDSKQEKLWLYNLHYFDDICSIEAPDRLALHTSLIDNWIRNNPPGWGNGWEAYPLSLRIVNWVKWFNNTVTPQQSWLDSLACQAHWLYQDLEFHILGNHLFANAKALVFAGTYLDVPEAYDWLMKGLSILEIEIPEQILPDGANFELSPMYHSIVLADLLDLINLAQSSNRRELGRCVNSWKDSASLMIGWLTKMCHSDGEVSFFNDSAFGVALSPTVLFKYANELGVDARVNGRTIKWGNGSCHSFAYSGYVVAESKDYKAILDCAKVGPDYLPGHAHADTLSFELSLFGRRLFVNSGTSCYGLSPERERQRGTAAHNTLVVDGVDSSEVWSGFRVARRAYPFDFSARAKNGCLLVEASHNGYIRLPGKVSHRRLWTFAKNTLQIEDLLGGKWSSATAHFHLYPGIKVMQENQTLAIILECGNRVIFESNGRVEIENSTWHPEFGTSIENQKIVVKLHQPYLKTLVTWS